MSRSSPIALAVALGLSLLATGCGDEDPLLPALTDDSTCEEAEAVVDVAIDEARLFIGTDNDDIFFGDQLVFALSAVDERPECFDTDKASLARGLRLTIAS